MRGSLLHLDLRRWGTGGARRRLTRDGDEAYPAPFTTTAMPLTGASPFFMDAA
jgi:hypothetical protein